MVISNQIGRVHIGLVIGRVGTNLYVNGLQGRLWVPWVLVRARMRGGTGTIIGFVRWQLRFVTRGSDDDSRFAAC